MEKLSIKCPAKLNLFLNILSKRKDGYHNLELINQSVDLFDYIEISKVKYAGIKIKCNLNNIPTNQENSVYKIAEKFFEYNNIKDYGIKIKIEKNIPVCSGLGGESTDAAGTLIVLNELYKTNMLLKEMMKISCEVGSDVPYFLIKGRCNVKGKGNKVKRLIKKEKFFYVIIKPEFGFSTKEMFGKVKSFEKAQIKLGFNDFEKYVYKSIKNIKNDILKYNSKFSMMTGSGSSIYGAFEKYDEALNCFLALKQKYNNIYLVNEEN